MEQVEDTLTQKSSIFSPFSYFFTILESYGWHILITGVILAYIYQTKLKPHVDEYMKKKGEAEYAAKYHKNPDLFHARLEAQQKLADKLQEKYKRDAEEYLKKQEEREQKKKEELAAKYIDDIGGHKLGKGSEDSKKKSFKPEYHPLMGSGSGSNYRPPKKSKCGGGGCGK